MKIKGFLIKIKERVKTFGNKCYNLYSDFIDWCTHSSTSTKN